jgi:hypothetical protein
MPKITGLNNNETIDLDDSLSGLYGDRQGRGRPGGFAGILVARPRHGHVGCATYAATALNYVAPGSVIMPRSLLTLTTPRWIE